MTPNSYQSLINFSNNNRIAKFHIYSKMIPRNVMATRNIFYYGINYWNQLPDYIKTCNSFFKFKKMLKVHLNCFN